jgi:DUF4097 and DUF4098 domain-containing protein YvlB
MVRAALAAASLSLVACNGDFNDRYHEQFHQAVAASATASVRVENIAGIVRVEGWPRSGVDVEATKYGYDASDVRSIAIVVTSTQSGVTIASRYARGVHGGGVRYRIRVPSGASLQVENTAGAVDVADVGGNLGIETEAGEITADAGRVDGSRSIDLRATTGAVTLYVAPGSSARVNASSTVGDFSSNVPGISSQRENLVGARGAGTIGTGAGRIRLSTTTGAITLRER